MEKEGFNVEIVSLKSGNIKSWDGDNWGKDFNPDNLRTEESALIFVRDFFKQSKPVCAICHAPWTLISADVVEGRTMTSFSSIRKDLENAGALWVDQEVVVDEALV